MENSFDRDLREKLNINNVSEAGFDLNKEALWNKINKKETKKKNPFLLYFSHAAAIAAGILIAVFLLTNYSKPKEQFVTKTIMIPSPVKEIKDTVYLPQMIVAIDKDKNKSKNQEIKTLPGTAISQEIAMTTKEEGNIAPIQVNNSQITIVSNTSVTMKHTPVLHLVDMDNENSITRKRDNSGYALFNKISIPARLDDKSETISMIVSNQFLHSKN